MRIANPIYDTVFKYLMEDSKIAKLLLSAIISQEITDLKFLPQERTTELDSKALTVFRIDFSATVKTPEGIKHIIIEIQKAKLATDIMRFRRYLGKQYLDRENYYEEVKNAKKIKIPMPTA